MAPIVGRHLTPQQLRSKSNPTKGTNPLSGFHIYVLALGHFDIYFVPKGRPSSIDPVVKAALDEVLLCTCFGTSLMHFPGENAHFLRKSATAKLLHI